MQHGFLIVQRRLLSIPLFITAILVHIDQGLKPTRMYGFKGGKMLRSIQDHQFSARMQRLNSIQHQIAYRYKLTLYVHASGPSTIPPSMHTSVRSTYRKWFECQAYPARRSQLISALFVNQLLELRPCRQYCFPHYWCRVSDAAITTAVTNEC